MKYFNIAAICTAIVLTGCCAGKDQSSPEAEMVYRRQGSEIIQAIADRDFECYQRNGGDTSGIAAGNEFILSCDDMESRMGKIENAEFITALETPGVVNLVYRVNFCRKTSAGEKLKHQQLFQLVFGRVDGKPRLLGMRIM